MFMHWLGQGGQYLRYEDELSLGLKKLASISSFQNYPIIPRTFIKLVLHQCPTNFKQISLIYQGNSKKSSKQFPNKSHIIMFKNFNRNFYKMSHSKCQILKIFLTVKLCQVSKSLHNIQVFQRSKAKGQNPLKRVSKVFFQF